MYNDKMNNLENLISAGELVRKNTTDSELRAKLTDFIIDTKVSLSVEKKRVAMLMVETIEKFDAILDSVYDRITDDDLCELLQTDYQRIYDESWAKAEELYNKALEDGADEGFLGNRVYQFKLELDSITNERNSVSGVASLFPNWSVDDEDIVI